ncbi:hypothetical protein [Neorhizobium sp. DT-125]|uniref:hypothetical protein n=1 Tax=Neorhizobium sp. DT-125 TaxID=3396163 RepID=UPI003F1B4701
MRILIVDPEYLVAMDAERIVGAAFECEIEIAMPRDYQASLEKRNFDVVLIDPSLVKSSEDMQRLRECGAGMVFTRSLPEEAAGILDRPDVAFTPKPFDDRQLIEAIRNAAGMKRHSVI